MNSSQKDAARRMREDGKSYAQIAVALSLSENTVKSFCRREGLQAATGQTLCPACGTAVRPGQRGQKRRFCSDALHGITPTGCLTPIMRSHAAVPAAGGNSSLTLRPTGNTVLTLAISPTGMERRRAVMLENKARAQRNYLSGMAVANDMLRRGLISEADFSALETVFAGKYRPLFRYEKPCLSPTLLITQTDEGRAKNE